MLRLPFAAALTSLALLAAACGGGSPDAVRTPTAKPSSGTNPTVSFTPPAPLPAEPIDRESAAEKFGGIVVDAESERTWWLRDRQGVWSPTENVLLITSCCVGTGGVELIEFPSGTATRLYYGDATAAGWSSDGRGIAFSTAESGPRHLYIVNRDGTGLRKLPAAAGGRITWSPAGEFIAVAEGTGFGVLHLATGEFTTVPDVNDWVWLPDGRSLAVADGAGLSVYDVETGARRVLAEGFASGAIHLSPDGSRIVLPFGERVTPNYGPYAGTPEAGSPPIVVFSLDGRGDPVSLGPARFPAWSPDGTRIAYESEGCVTGAWDIYVTTLDGAEPRRLTNTPDAFKEGPEWSPDGSTIAFATHDQLMLIDAASGEVTSVLDSEDGQGYHLHGEGWGYGSSRSADGRYLLLGAGGGHGVCD